MDGEIQRAIFVAPEPATTLLHLVAPAAVGLLARGRAVRGEYR